MVFFFCSAESVTLWIIFSAFSMVHCCISIVVMLHGNLLFINSIDMLEALKLKVLGQNSKQLADISSQIFIELAVIKGSFVYSIWSLSCLDFTKWQFFEQFCNCAQYDIQAWKKAVHSYIHKRTDRYKSNISIGHHTFWRSIILICFLDCVCGRLKAMLEINYGITLKVYLDQKRFSQATW